ncbi:MAG: hypothetical protein V4864_04870 [Pseudomonadota bacterium]
MSGIGAAADPLYDSPRMVAQRRQLTRSFGPHAVAQLGKEGEGEQGDQDREEQRLVVAQQNAVRNQQLLEHVFPQLPRRVQQYLAWVQSRLSPQEDSSVGALVARREPSPALLQVFGMDSSLFASILVGLKVMPRTEALPTTLPGIRQLFFTLASTRYGLSGSVRLLEGGEPAPVEIEHGEQRGVEHVQSSCYAASILNLIAAVPPYRQLFDNSRNPTQPDSEARLLQRTIAPLLRTLGSDGTVRAAEVRGLLHLLNVLGLLHGGEDALAGQQDASQVLMGILQRVQPQRDQLLTAHGVAYDNPDAQNRNGIRLERQAVLQLTAVGHRTLEQALAAYFGMERRDRNDVENPHTAITRAVSFPQVLSIGMLRQDGSDHVDMPQVFRIPATITGNGRPGPRYRLQAFIVRNTFSHHSGGHYVSVVNDGQGSWFESDDMGGKRKPREVGVFSPRTRSVDVSRHAVEDHPAPAYALATLYTYVRDEDQRGDAPDRVSFPGAERLGEDALARSVFDSVEPKDKDERQRLTRTFLNRGGSEWEAIDLMRRLRNNKHLADAYELALDTNRGRDRKGKGKDKNKDLSDDDFYLNFKRQPTSTLLDWARTLPEEVRRGEKDSAEQLEAVRAILRERENALLGEDDYGLLFAEENKAGVRLEIYGTANVTKAQAKLIPWMDGVSRALLGSAFLASRKPPLRIRIRLRPTVTADIASTHSEGSRITINLDDYQVTDFTVGQTIGLLAHEIGVHSLDSSTLSEKELQAEEKDKNSRQKGKHGGESFTIVKDPKLEKQQDDHLTIGRGILGQLSALPRLNMYESTLISLLEALPPGRDRWEAAAAYCIDIARILVNNDDPTELMESNKISQLWTARQLSITAANEWLRMQAKHAGNAVVNSIEITAWQIFEALFALLKVLDKVKKEAGKKK